MTYIGTTCGCFPACCWRTEKHGTVLDHLAKPHHEQMGTQGVWNPNATLKQLSGCNGKESGLHHRMGCGRKTCLLFGHSCSFTRHVKCCVLLMPGTSDDLHLWRVWLSSRDVPNWFTEQQGKRTLEGDSVVNRAQVPPHVRFDNGTNTSFMETHFGHGEQHETTLVKAWAVFRACRQRRSAGLDGRHQPCETGVQSRATACDEAVRFP